MPATLPQHLVQVGHRGIHSITSSARASSVGGRGRPSIRAVWSLMISSNPLIKLSYRPPNYETPIEYLRTAITSNEAFFVRNHLSNIPEVDAATWKLAVGVERVQ